jgi:hypothetical protein
MGCGITGIGDGQCGLFIMRGRIYAESAGVEKKCIDAIAMIHRFSWFGWVMYCCG